MNSIGVIFPYKRNGIWAFDDASTGLAQEPFVLGVPEMIDVFVRDIPEAESGFALYFSECPFPGHQAELVWVREEAGGNWYRETRTGLEGWLCPSLFRYFAIAPPRLFCAATPRPARGI
jgi:hypothetical protein